MGRLEAPIVYHWRIVFRVDPEERCSTDQELLEREA